MSKFKDASHFFDRIDSSMRNNRLNRLRALVGKTWFTASTALQVLSIVSDNSRVHANNDENVVKAAIAAAAIYYTIFNNRIIDGEITHALPVRSLLLLAAGDLFKRSYIFSYMPEKKRVLIEQAVDNISGATALGRHQAGNPDTSLRELRSLISVPSLGC